MSDETSPAAELASENAERTDAYRVSLPMFEGPLDLLLHLIQKHELNILDIPIGFVAQKYFEYIDLMEELSIDLASEYLVMAATLVHLKSRSLLPADPHPGEDADVAEEEEDPRTELIRRLLEYQKYKHAAESLAARPVMGRDVFPRGTPIDVSTEPAPLAPLALFKLVDAFEAVLKRAKRVVEHEVDFERVTITDKIGQIGEMLRAKGMLRFEQLFEADSSRAEMIVTFLALLEMTKLRMTRLRQDRPLDPIYVELAVEDDGHFAESETRALSSNSEDAGDVFSELTDAALVESTLWDDEEPDHAADNGATQATAPEQHSAPDNDLPLTDTADSDAFESADVDPDTDTIEPDTADTDTTESDAPEEPTAEVHSATEADELEAEPDALTSEPSAVPAAVPARDLRPVDLQRTAAPELELSESPSGDPPASPQAQPGPAATAAVAEHAAAEAAAALEATELATEHAPAPVDVAEPAEDLAAPFAAAPFAAAPFVAPASTATPVAAPAAAEASADVAAASEPSSAATVATENAAVSQDDSASDASGSAPPRHD